jgi:hypothetical protein
MTEPEIPGESTPSTPHPPPEALAEQQLTPEGGSLPTNLVGVLFSPGPTFRRILGRPAWVGALAVYIAIVGISVLVYSLNVDWETMYRGQLEDSLVWRLVSATVTEDQLDNLERSAVNEIVSTGRSGMALTTTVQSVLFGTIAVHAMAVLFATLFYLMGSLGDLKLGRVYLDAFLCLVIIIVFSVLNTFIRGFFGLEAREALPYQAGLNVTLFFLYAWLLYRSVERQPAFKRLMAVYAHGMAVPAIAALAVILVVFLHQGPVTVPGDQVLRSNLGAILAMEGTGVLPTLLSALDIFTLWELAVVAIGFAVVSRLSVGASFAITFLPWGFVTMARVALAAVVGA